MAQLRYCIPEYIAYVHTDEFAKYSPTASYLADLRTSSIAVLEGSASIIWGVFEVPLALPEAIEEIAELAEQDPAAIAEQVQDFVTDLVSREYLEEL